MISPLFSFTLPLIIRQLLADIIAIDIFITLFCHYATIVYITWYYLFIFLLLLPWCLMLLIIIAFRYAILILLIFAFRHWALPLADMPLPELRYWLPLFIDAEIAFRITIDYFSSLFLFVFRLLMPLFSLIWSFHWLLSPLLLLFIYCRLLLRHLLFALFIADAATLMPLMAATYIFIDDADFIDIDATRW